MLDKLKALLKSKLPDKATDIDALTDAEIKALIPDVVEPKTAPTTTTTGNPDIQAIIKQAIEPFMAEVQSVKTLLGEERTKREAAEKTLSEKLKADTQAKVKATLDKAIAEGRIPAKNEEQIKKWTARLESNFEDQAEILNTLPATTKATTTARTENTSGASANGTSVIAQLKQNAIEAFKNS
jgi:hypothetical protein